MAKVKFDGFFDKEVVAAFVKAGYTVTPIKTECAYGPHSSTAVIIAGIIVEVPDENVEVNNLQSENKSTVDKDDRVFSGPNSKALWHEINNVSDDEAHSALYLLGCKLQEFEEKHLSKEK